MFYLKGHWALWGFSFWKIFYLYKFLAVSIDNRRNMRYINDIKMISN